MRFLKEWFGRGRRSSVRRSQARSATPGLEMLERRDLLNGSPLPVLMVLADQRDFYYTEYSDTRMSLEAAGLDVVVAAATTQPTTPHWNSGQGESTGEVVPDLALSAASADDYSAIVFVGGWGSSMYQYAYNDPNLDGTTDNYYADNHYNGDDDIWDGVIAPTKVAVNNLINDFLADDKHVAAICHGVTVLAWARVDGVSPLAGRQVAVPLTVGSPTQFYNGAWAPYPSLSGQYDQVIANGGLANPVSGQYGDPGTVADDVVVDGRIITAENYDSALHFGEVIAQEITSSNDAPQVQDAAWTLEENSPAGTVAGNVSAFDPDVGQTLSYAIVAGNTYGAFAIDAATGVVTVANAAAINFEATPSFTLTVQATDNGNPALEGFGEITIDLLNVVEPSVSFTGMDVLVTGTVNADTMYLWSGATSNQVYAWVNGEQSGPFLLPEGGRVVVHGGDGNDQIYATDLRVGATIYGEGGHDQITGGKADDILDGGDGWDRIWAGAGNDLLIGGAGNDFLHGREGSDIILGGAGDDRLDGFDGRDLLLGGLGGDHLNGGAGEDLLIGGTTSYDDDHAALAAVMAGWTAADDMADRIEMLSAGVDGGYRLQWGETLQDDGVSDVFLGGPDADWLLAALSDALCQDDDDAVTLA